MNQQEWNAQRLECLESRTTKVAEQLEALEGAIIMKTRTMILTLLVSVPFVYLLFHFAWWLGAQL